LEDLLPSDRLEIDKTEAEIFAKVAAGGAITDWEMNGAARYLDYLTQRSLPKY